MTVGKAVYNILKSDSSVISKVGITGIYPEIAPELNRTQIESQRYVVYSVVSNVPSDTKEDNGKVDVATVEIYSFSYTYKTAVDLGVAVRAALDRKNGTFGGIKIQSINYTNEQMDVNPERSIWVSIQDYTIRVNNT